MNLLDYQRLLAHPGFAMYCSKPYGLELMFVLDNAAASSSDNGIDDTYDIVLFNRPRRRAFSSFIQTLEYKNHIRRIPSTTKKSKVVLRLSDDTAEVFKVFRGL